MGNSASRAARKLPNRAEPPPLASNRTPNLTNRPNGVNREHVRDELASERKTEAIKQDAFDPHFLANVRKLGAVQVDHHMQTIRPDAVASGTTELFKARTKDLEMAQQQDTATTTTTDITNGRLYASQLSSALNTRKGIKTIDEMKKLSSASKISFERLESVARFVNTPSVSKGGVRTFVDKDGNESTIAKVRIYLVADWLPCVDGGLLERRCG
ncbi:hypothetical protein AGABI2DRAFT_64139 [Agaricus bisporus var. bisporus H97]|uniref:hypothetical protein n=1 Tax=Agaricus bisporus var. bisporus (strain H97 / ATCC MYA-4626 / FGSC 10389) TaxID=936046 RepID=UPI00029F7459|nr:hypothetical protein AGABI2DRAFT_64139 [Agaricus bisporus var. bisporus H97]EKV50379.1 hypothetical protein AGABI2DRAFT_64139 [Agaricus bisporus var. bisporus H97]